MDGQNLNEDAQSPLAENYSDNRTPAAQQPQAFAPPARSLADQKQTNRRPLQLKRFVIGLISSTSGILVMLTVAMGTLQNYGASGRLSLPAVGLCMIAGLMLLGGGFGIMATAVPTFEDGKFDRWLLSDHDTVAVESAGPQTSTNGQAGSQSLSKPSQQPIQGIS